MPQVEKLYFTLLNVVFSMLQNRSIRMTEQQLSLWVAMVTIGG
tara:strand:- start:187 stop:315 length:129 start_codon:yes stop_codon:yes gene_type:complete